MCATDLIFELRRTGCSIRADGDYLDVSPAENITPELVHRLRLNKSEILAELQREDAATRAWLARIGETDQATITEVLTACRTDPEARAYFLRRAEEGQALPDPVEARRQKVIGMLEAQPGLRYALAADADADPVILTMGIRAALQDGSIVTCELHIPRDRYDPFLLLATLERHGDTVH